MARRILTASEAEWIAQYVEHCMANCRVISKRNKQIFLLRFGKHMSSPKIAQRFEISVQRVNQICNRILELVQRYSKFRIPILFTEE